MQDYLKKQRDTYKFIHDQTVRLMNQGYVGTEIAEAIKMPPSLAQEWSTHPFYGQLKNNVKAVYQRYLGTFDGNPAVLEALPPVPAAKKAVEYMGGAGAVLSRARDDFSRANTAGWLRWRRSSCSPSPEPGGARPHRRRLRAAGLPDGIRHRGNAFPQGAWGSRNGVPKLPPRGRARPTSSVP